MAKYILLIVALIFPAVSFSGSIYEDARQQAIALYNAGQYRDAASQFVAVQNIAPVFNDLTLWLSKCNRQIALQNNKRRLSKRKPVNRSTTTSNNQSIQHDDFVVYDSIGRYNNDGIALAMLDGKFGYVDRKKKIIVPVIYDNVDIFGKPSEISVGDFYRSIISYKGDWSGIAMSVQRNGKWGFADKNGKEIIPCKYDIVENHLLKTDSIIPVALGDKFGYISTKDEIVIPFIYEFAGRFSSNGLAPVVKDNKLGFIDYSGETIIDFIFDPKYEISNGKATIRDSFWLNKTIAICKDGKWGLINDKGEEEYPFVFDDFVTWSLQGTGYQNMHIFTFVKEGKECYLFNGKIYHSEDELTEAKLRFKAEFKDPEFIYDLAAYYWNKGEYNPSSIWASKGDELNHAGCSRLLGAYWLFYTDSPTMAYVYLRKAAEKEDDIAQYLLGFMYDNNIIEDSSLHSIFSKDDSEAVKWYKKSAKNGNQQAIERLKSMGLYTE